MPYHIYITTNPNKKSLYIGVTNNLEQRIIEHYLNRGKPKTYAGKYFCYNLIYYESFQYIEEAIAREKEIKGWVRIKKEKLIDTFNLERKFLNNELFGHWPPKETLYNRNE